MMHELFEPRSRQSTYQITLFLSLLYDVHAQFLLDDKTMQQWSTAQTTCERQNSSLVLITDRIDIELTHYLKNRTVDFTFWTKHRANSQILGISYEPFPTAVLTSLNYLCVYAIFEVTNRRFGWSTAKCQDLHYVVCYKVPMTDPPVEVILYTGSCKTNQLNASNICLETGMTLVEIENNAKSDAIFGFLMESPWSQASVANFWTGHLSINSYTDTVFTTLFPTYTAQSMNMLTWVGEFYCVTAVVDRQYKQLGWTTKDCNTQIQEFMCQRSLDDCYFKVHAGVKSENNVIKSEVNAVYKCERECRLMVLDGTPCGGFNYNNSKEECTYLKLTEADTLSLKEDHDYVDLHEKICTIKPILVFCDGTINTGSGSGNVNTSSVPESPVIPGSGNVNTSSVIGSPVNPGSGNVNTSSVTEASCTCVCDTTKQTVNISIEKIMEDITVDKKTTSAYKRKFYSAPDSRISSTGMGITAGVILMSVAFGVVAMDSHRITASVHIFWQRLHKIFNF